MSRFHNRNFELLEPYEGKLSRTVLRGERGSNAPDLPDKKYYDALKSVNNLVRDARKVQQTILMVGEISEMYVVNFRRMMADKNFLPEELTAIAFGYTKLLEQSSFLLDDLKQIVTVTGLQMSDRDRMDVIDKVYNDVLRYRNLTDYYTRKNISVSYLRSKQAGDTERIRALYGSQNEGYW